MESEKFELNKKLNEIEGRVEALTMEIGQLYVKYINTKSQTLIELLDEKVKKVNQLEEELHNINNRLGLH